MSEFTDYLQEVFSCLGTVRVRRMFGGHGLFLDELMFGLVVDEVLYLKADEQTRDLFTAEGLTPFVYYKQGKPVSLSYYTAPESLFEDPDEALLWGRRSFSAALRNKRH